MTGDAWAHAAIAIVLGVHLLALTYAAVARGRGRRGPVESRTDALGEAGDRFGDDGDGPADAAETADGVCRCPDCGAENEAEYRFCRRCVAELPGSSPVPRRSSERSHPY